MIKKSKRLVVKVGTESLIGKSGEAKGRLDQEIFNHIAEQIGFCDINVVIVSSGAIKAGREYLERLGDNQSNRFLNKKEIAGVGARHLLNFWGRAFEHRSGIPISQILVTYGNWTAEQEKRSIKSSILHYLRCGVVPIVNENDVVSDKEIQLMERGRSENDNLAGMVALLINADSILFLTDVGGVYEKDPRRNKEARMYTEIDYRTAKRIIDSFKGKSPNGIGGMKAKLMAAVHCFEAEMRVAIAGVDGDTISEFAQGQAVGTMIGAVTKLK